MPKYMKVDFFKVALPKNAPRTFDSILDSITKSPADHTRNEKRDGDPIRLQEASKSLDRWEGDMIRIRMSEMPWKANIDGTLEPLDLEDDEGLGDGAAFLYYAPTQTLVLQRNRSGVTATAFEWYFKNKGDQPGIELLPVIRSDALVLLSKMKQIRKLEIKLAGADNMSVFSNQGRGVNSIINLSKEFQAPSISVTLSMGRSPGSLHHAIEAAKRFAKLTPSTGAEVQKVQVVGEYEDEHRDILDLIEYKMMETIQLPDSQSRSVAYVDRLHAVREAWGKRKTEIVKMFEASSGGHE